MFWICEGCSDHLKQVGFVIRIVILSYINIICKEPRIKRSKLHDIYRMKCSGVILYPRE